MTPRERAQKVVEEVREHKMFNVDTDGTWERYITSAIKCALDDALPDANNLDDVVHALGIEDSDTTPAEAVQMLQDKIAALQAALSDLLKTTPEDRQDPAIWFARVDAARAALGAW